MEGRRDDSVQPLPERVGAWGQELARADLAALDDEARLTLLRNLEDLARVVGAVSVGTQVAFEVSQVTTQASRGVPASRRGKAVADELARARKTSPYWASRELTSSRALVQEMPLTWAALRAGSISGLQARLVTEATTCLSPQDRAEVDRRLQESLEGASTKQIVAAARALTYEVDPAGFVGRARRAAKDRGVSLRPTPDVMALLSARLPAPQAIAAFTTLKSQAQSLRSAGDPRTVAQLMADTLYARLTGREVVDGVDVEVGVVLTDSALFDGDHTAADLVGYGPIPADLARDLLDDDDRASSTTDSEAPEAEPRVCPAGGRCTSAACTLVHDGSIPTGPPPDMGSARGRTDDAGSADDAGPADDVGGADDAGNTRTRDGTRAARVWLRRLYADPATGVLDVRDPRRRLFTGNLRATLIMRGRYCANAWCGAPVRHVDHTRRWSEGGLTVETNGRGLCARCNLAREHPRHADPDPTSYRDPPPVLDGFLGRPPRAAPRPRAAPDDPPGGPGDAGDASPTRAA